MKSVCVYGRRVSGWEDEGPVREESKTPRSDSSGLVWYGRTLQQGPGWDLLDSGRTGQLVVSLGQ